MNCFRFLILFCLFSINCKAKFQNYLEEEYKNRIGTPEILKLDGLNISAENFRNQMIFSRRTFEHKFTEPTPEEVEQYLSNYIEETILLRKALEETDFDSKDAHHYMQRALREAAINYWLDKKSGALEIAKNPESFKIDSSLIEGYQKQSKNLQKLSAKEIEKEAKLIKIQKIYESAQLKRRLIVGKTKRESKVQIVPKEIYSPIKN